jgi:hypothetical protein
MSSTRERNPLGDVVGWLARHTGFPVHRLPAKAETMVCVAALAAEEEEEERQRFLIQRRNPAETSAQRQHAHRRSAVHFKCDNSAKV